MAPTPATGLPVEGGHQAVNEAAVSLGNHRESTNPPDQPIAPEPAGDGDSEGYRASGRRERYRLLNAAGEVLGNRHRTHHCMQRRVATAVGIYRGAAGAHYHGVMTCGSVWTCPVCNARISEQRRREVAKAMREHQAAGGEVLMVTFTAPHTRDDELRPWKAAFQDAMQRFKRGNPFKRIKERLGQVGHIRAMEVTWGEANGWHPHVHEVWFVDPGADRQALQAQLFERWRKMAVKAGLPEPDAEHGVTVQGADRAADYIAKWGKEPENPKGWDGADELTKANSKTAKGERFTPWDMLRRYADAGDSRMAAMFREFAGAFHGTQQLVWSKGLKDHFGVEEVDDEEAAAEGVQADDEAVAVLYRKHWGVVIHEQAQAEVLEVAEREGYEGLRQWFRQRGMLLPEPPTMRKSDAPRPGRGMPMDHWGVTDRDIEGDELVWAFREYQGVRK